ncbi:MAG: type IV pilus twitching motility protein PilT [Oscillospiraceae bacterium]|jgi:twitching motility protein PilT|nr:type IV pilus twitching motility protein PilT [Oscillospiraceae bacterium]
MLTFDQLIREAIKRHASDIHLTSGRAPSCRIYGELSFMDDQKLMPADTEAVAREIMDEAHEKIFRENGEVDFAYSIEGVGRFRVNVFLQRGSIAVAARILNLRIPSPRELGIPENVVKLTEKKRGLVLVTGATGSGKSTTLASLIDIINHTYCYHIITLEDPIEYLHHHNKSIVNQREIGSDSKSYAAALRAALRQDPDVILVGEMRDLETISIAVTAAETGHLVFSTLHTIGTASTVDRIIDVFPPYQQQQIRMQLADVLECVVSQQLLPKADGNGRVAAMEVMIANSAIKNHIREAKTYQILSDLQTGRRFGMQTMDDAIYELYCRGTVSGETALLFAQNRIGLAKKIGK